MGKQAKHDPRAALANALNSTGVAKAAPPKKEPVKEPPAPAKGQGKRRKEQPAEQPKTKKEIEEEQRKFVQDKEKEKADFYASEAARKIQERKGADASVTYVEDKDTRKPKAVNDISDYWKADMGFLPFMPGDNIGDLEVTDEIDPQDRLEYLQMLNEQLEKLLRLKFNVFWSQVIYDTQVRRFLDSYLRYALRSHDVQEGSRAAGGTKGQDLVAEEEESAAREISRRVLAVYVRLSRAQETQHDWMSEGKWGNVILEHGLFDVPKLIDLCAIYGDSNRNAVTKIVHSVFALQPLYTDEFESVVQHMLSGLHQCCEPLQQQAAGGSASQRKAPSAGLSQEECLAFLPDVLCCFNSIFCFFPEECVDNVVKGKLSEPAGKQKGAASAAATPLADLMVELHDALMDMEKRKSGDQDALSTVVTLLSRLLGLVLGFRMAPRNGAKAFEDLLEWLRSHDEQTTMLFDLGRYGLQNLAMEWLASGMVDEAQLDYLEQLCGPVLPAGERSRGRRLAAAMPARGAGGAAGSAGGATASSSAAPKPGGATAEASSSDKAKVKEVREVVGNDYGEGFVLQCLLHFGGSVPAVVGAIFDGSIPPHIAALPQNLSMSAGFAAVAVQQEKPELTRNLSREEKQRVLGQASRMQEEAAARANDVSQNLAGYNDIYDDDVDDSMAVPSGLRVGGAAGSDSEGEGEEEGEGSEDEEDGEDPRWRNNAGGKGKGKGKGGKFGPVQGQTIGARRKEANKAYVANHNRRDAAMKKMSRGMM